MPNNDELESLLKIVAQRLGTNPQELKNQAQSGNLNKIFNQMSPNDAAKMEQVLNDKNAASKLLSTPQAQAILQQLLGGK